MPIEFLYLAIVFAVAIIWFAALKRPMYEAMLVAFVVLVVVTALGVRFFGVAKLDIKAGELGALAVTGVYEMAKAAGVAFALGSEVAWDRTNRKAVAPGTSGSAKIGHAVALTGASDATVFVRLCPGIE